MSKNKMPDGVKTVIAWAIGIGILAMIALILVILFGNLSGNTGISDGKSFITITNTTGGADPAHANRTGYTLSGYNSSWSGITITSVFNSSDKAGGSGGYNISVPLSNVSVSSVGVLKNATNAEYDNISISYTYTHTFTTEIEAGAESVILNFTQAQTNMSKQLPTVGIILGVALLLVILIGVLIFAIRKLMNASNATGGSAGGGLNGNSELG